MSRAHECGVCWYVYSAERGDDVWQIPPGTAFEALPPDWRCPRCDAAKGRFLAVADAAVDPRVTRLVAAAARAGETTMKGLPIVNPRLNVEAVGFRAWGRGLLGALVTPWSINAVFFPPPGPPTPARGRVVELPAGPVDFLPLPLADGGCAELASLFSPAHEFDSQDAARATASAALEFLLAPPNPAGPMLTSRRQLLAPLLGK